MNHYTECMFIYLLKYWVEFILPTTLQESSKKKNVIKLVPMNQDVSLAEKDVLKIGKSVRKPS